MLERQCYTKIMERKKKRSHDFAVIAFRVVQEATRQIERPKKARKEYDYKALGHAGGLKGGRARAEKLTPEERSEIARKGAQARWEAKV
jgi:hypothetical protein